MFKTNYNNQYQLLYVLTQTIDTVQQLGNNINNIIKLLIHTFFTKKGFEVPLCECVSSGAELNGDPAPFFGKKLVDDIVNH